MPVDFISVKAVSGYTFVGSEKNSEAPVQPKALPLTFFHSNAVFGDGQFVLDPLVGVRFVLA